MFLQCRTQHIQVPKSSGDTFVFPFSNYRCQYLFNAKKYDAIALNLPISRVQYHLKAIHAACDDFKKLKVIRNAFALLLVLTLAGILTGGGIINSGIMKEEASTLSDQIVDGTTTIIYFSNQKITAGAVIIALSLVLCLLFTVLLVRYTRRLRIEYETKIFDAVQSVNAELKNQEIRWKIGHHLLWLEISLDFKKRTAIDTSPKAKDNIRLDDESPREIQSRNNIGGETELLNIKIVTDK